jgi:lipopolysaccharide assembly outer membrane protein LptD (OstA)
MKRVALIAGVAVLAIAQTPIQRGELRIMSLTQERAGSVIHLTGKVMVETDSMVLQADEADYNSDTREIRAKGAVHIKLK